MSALRPRCVLFLRGSCAQLVSIAVFGTPLTAARQGVRRARPCSLGLPLRGRGLPSMMLRPASNDMVRRRRVQSMARLCAMHEASFSACARPRISVRRVHSFSIVSCAMSSASSPLAAKASAVATALCLMRVAICSNSACSIVAFLNNKRIST